MRLEFRWAEARYDRLPVLTADLVRRPVDVMVAAYLPAALAAKSATETIPTVFVIGSDPVASRFGYQSEPADGERHGDHDPARHFGSKTV